MKPLYAFFHLKKTAGMSVHAHMNRLLGKQKTMMIGRGSSPSRYFFADKSNLASFSKTDRERIVYVGGHYAGKPVVSFFPNRDIRFFTLLRDPVERIISHYNHNLRIGAIVPSTRFTDFYASCQPNYMATHLLHLFAGMSLLRIYTMSLDQQWRWVNETLRTFWFVGNYHRLQEPVDHILREQQTLSPPIRRLNHSLANQLERTQLTKETEERIVADNMLDCELFECWKDTGFATSGVSPTVPASLHTSRSVIWPLIKTLNKKTVFVMQDNKVRRKTWHKIVRALPDWSEKADKMNAAGLIDSVSAIETAPSK